MKYLQTKYPENYPLEKIPFILRLGDNLIDVQGKGAEPDFDYSALPYDYLVTDRPRKLKIEVASLDDFLALALDSGLTMSAFLAKSSCCGRCSHSRHAATDPS